VLYKTAPYLVSYSRQHSSPQTLHCPLETDILPTRIFKLRVTRGSAGNLALTVLEGSIDGLRHQGRPNRTTVATFS